MPRSTTLVALALVTSSFACGGDDSVSDTSPPDTGAVDSAVMDSAAMDSAASDGGDAARDSSASDASADSAVADASDDVGDATSDAPGAGSCGAAIEALLSSDRTLVLSGTNTVTLPAGPCVLSRICLSDSAAILVDRTARLEITGDAPSVMMGAGIGSIDTDLARLEVAFTGSADSYFRIENMAAPFELDLNAPTHSVTILITGAAGLTVSGVADTITYGGDPSTFPACP